MSKIKLNTRPFNLKLKYPFGISRGSITQAKNVLVTLTYDDIVAYGEAAPSTFYGEDQNTVADYIYSFIKNKSIEEYLTNIQTLKNDLMIFSSTKFFGFSASARASIEMAFWDLLGKINNRSLYQFFFQDDPFIAINNEYKSICPTSYTIGLDTLLVIKDKIKNALSCGYKILKVKLGLSYEDDLLILKTINEQTKNKNCVLRVDANGGWDIDTTKRMLEMLPSFNVELLEQPLQKGQSHLLSKLISDSPVPIFVDEDCMESRDIESLAGSVHGVNIKLMKTGSIIETLNMINLAKSYNLKVMLGCMIESSCGIAAAVHLSPLADYIDLDGHLLLENDPFSGLILEDNKVLPSLDFGLGVSLVN